MGKKGQVTIFVIIAIVIVVAGILIYQFVPGLKSTASQAEENPEAYIQNCLMEDFENNIDLISKQGGTIIPDFYYLYNDTEINYLCYTSEYYTPCVVQKPMLITGVKKELKDSMTSRVDECFNSLVADLRDSGYDVQIDRKPHEIILIPDNVKLITNTTLTTTRSGDTKRYESFGITLNKNLYEVLDVSYNILTWEAEYGDSDVDLYMIFNPYIVINKIKRTDGTKIYTIKETNTNAYFQFASRSIVMSP